MDINSLYLLMQYISSLDEASRNLESAVLKDDYQKASEIKRFILEIKYKIDEMLQ